MNAMNAPLDASGLTANHDLNFDVVVVGSGAGGAVLAKELAEGGMRVAIVEEGGDVVPRNNSAPEAFAMLYRDSGFTATVGNPIIPVPMGRVFGGSTTVNSGTCFRTPTTVLEQWSSKLGLNALCGEALHAAFDKVEGELGVAPARFEVMSRPNTLIHELLAKRGEAGEPLPRNAPTCDGCGMCCYGCTSKAKRSMELSYLPKALAAGAQAFVHARAARILRDGNGAAAGVVAKAVDARYRATGRKLTLRAPRVVLACGTMLTPALLAGNGIARGNPHLGRHLSIHPASKVAAEFDEDIRQWEGIPQAYGYDGLRDDGIKFEGISMPPDSGPAMIPLLGERLAHYTRHYRNIATFGFMISDTAEGTMWRVPGQGPIFHYSLTPTDTERMKRAIVFLAKLYLENGAKRAWAMVRRPDNEFTSIADVDRFASQPIAAHEIEAMAFHPLASCRMGRNAEHGVCGQDHQVFGAPGVYVCDGGIVPTALGVNPQETIMAFATRLAGLLLR